MRVEKLVLLSLLIAMVALAGCSQSQAPKQTPSVTPSPTTPSGGAGGIGGVPTYSGSRLYTAPTFYYQIMGIPTEGVSVKVYYVEKAKVKDILNWYKEKLSDYEVVQDMAIATVSTPQGSAEWGGVLFKKGDKAVGVWALSGSAVEGGKGTVYYLVEGPADKIVEGSSSSSAEAEQLPPADQASGDEPIARYPGSVMLNYYKDTSNPLELKIQIDYGTKDKAAKVADWLKKDLQAKGWIVEEESADDSAIYLTLSKGNEYLDIAVMKPSETTAYTEIDLSYSKKGLPSKDVVQGEEPIKRYPGSVMLEHSTTTAGGAKVIQITYGTNDDPKKVFDWYNNELKNEGWQISVTSSGETFSLYAMKGNAMVQLEISKKAYTTVELTYSGPA